MFLSLIFQPSQDTKLSILGFTWEARKYLCRTSVSSAQVLSISSASVYWIQTSACFSVGGFFSPVFSCIYFVDSFKTLIIPWQKDQWEGRSVFSFGQMTFKCFLGFQKKNTYLSSLKDGSFARKCLKQLQIPPEK